MRYFIALVFTLVLAVPLTAQEPEWGLFVQQRPALVYDGSEDAVYRHTGLEVVSYGDFSFSVFHISSRPFSVLELTPGHDIQLSSWVTVTPGVTAIWDSFGSQMVGPNLGLNIGDGVIHIPLLRYLRSTTGDDTHQWAIIANLNLGLFKGTFQTFNDVWEASLGPDLGAAFAQSAPWLPEVRLGANTNGLVVEMRLSGDVF